MTFIINKKEKIIQITQNKRNQKLLVNINKKGLNKKKLKLFLLITIILSLTIVKRVYYFSQC